ncbi:hypothetical protein FIU94_03560 [Sulfitobacter sp. THAF37]|uniref:hypothetical protein n=1 Tax=Sulfitobacter sp. THAF37 TaxID=2587855 RepID=UPI0012A9ED6D|nr:hypothetical protein [Sulfitobacter sp. THAF37]QFT57891.1 hypothetical protein FIU94_03560 [Sulfitobacter sp. THAF37]
MPVSIRPAAPSDLDDLAVLLLSDAKARQDANPGLWRLSPSPLERVRESLQAAMEATNPPVRQQWLIAVDKGRTVGVTHSILLPVPPIYAGRFGPPGLVMEDCHVCPDAPAGTRQALLEAAEADLKTAGAVILLASSISGGDWEGDFATQGYAPLTAYLVKSGLSASTVSGTVRPAVEADVPGIVTASAVHRRVLDQLNHRFWEPHTQADARFGAWMRRSLTLEDRDMFVSEDHGRIRGYAISQPATPLHFPVPHDISGVGVIDDFFHDAIEDPGARKVQDEGARALITAAEAARAARGDHAVMVVCPARWQSKIDMLGSLGYRTAITWHIKE